MNIQPVPENLIFQQTQRMRMVLAKRLLPFSFFVIHTTKGMVLMKTCPYFEENNCIGCGYEYCIEPRKCFGMCHVCINNGCDNHPQNPERYGSAGEL